METKTNRTGNEKKDLLARLEKDEVAAQKAKELGSAPENYEAARKSRLRRISRLKEEIAKERG